MTQFEFHDMHVHTRPHSPDAHWWATVSAMLNRAAKNDVWTIGLANHYFLNTNFETFIRLRQQVKKKTPAGMTVFIGAELCVLDTTGAVNLTETEARQLDFVLAGPHHFKQRWVEKPPLGSAVDFIQHQHHMLLKAACNPLVNGLAHPWVINVHEARQRWNFSPTDFLAVWTDDYFAQLGEVAKNHNTALEIGMGIHMMAQHQGDSFWQQYTKGLQAARLAGAKFYFGSDAHHLFVIARLDWLKPTLNKLGFKPKDIISPFDWLK